jgi:solute carrier family 25 (adenine nucleotide translocator) protein 4/5/6/31
MDKPFSSVLDCARRTLATEGVLAFWRGNLANVMRYFPTKGLNFAFRDTFKTAFSTPSNAAPYAKRFLMNALSGGCAGSITLIFVYSLDFARTRLANDIRSPREFSGLVNVYVKTLRSDGLAGLYRGFVVSCVGVFVYYGLYFGLYDSLKPVLLGDDANVGLSFALGWGVTATAGLIAYPIDTVRRRMMMTSGATQRYKGSLDCATKIIKTEGFTAMMRGAGTNIFRGVAGAGVLTSFDALKDIYVKWRLGA